MRLIAAIIGSTFVPTFVAAQDARALCDTAAAMANRSVHATAEQAMAVNSLRIITSLWLDVPLARREELQAFIDNMIENQNVEMNQTIAEAKVLLALCQAH
ncbi:hypothetical protein CKO11_06760 [Rhodobacter sp. TJ_12]|uniref:hypothetical protein n=1 Tax=Rhodobacter sp. TJ_12 TaxID=2029399 RepID=UPI001CBD3C82|nr:hypothetical protein [Rhodobacter sp. TJ_12]MBZ4022157.1 hypothetical protein [Rhodobacter sp. TJ_12]